MADLRLVASEKGPIEGHRCKMDDWYFMHEGTLGGPTPLAVLRSMAAEGKLAPNDAVWVKGTSPATAVLARTIVPFSQSPVQHGVAPDWLGDVRDDERRVSSAGTRARPDWLEGVRQAEEAEAVSAMVPTVAPRPGPPQHRKTPPPLLPQPEQGPVLVPVVSLTSPDSSPKSIRGPLLAETGQGKLEIGSATFRGMVRPHNEDSFLVLQSSWANLDRRHEMAVVVVSDGRGEHQAGARASGLVISVMGKALAPLLAGAILGSSTTTASAFPPAIDLAFGQAHRSVADAGKADPRCKDMVATAVAVVLLDEEAHLGLVGDCRVYHQRGNHLTQLTRDQTIVAHRAELGQVEPQEVVHSPRGKEVTQALGSHGTIQPVKYEQRLQPGDWLVVCCDGLYAHVEDRLLQQTIGLWALSPRALALHLVELANRLGGNDNCTVVAIHYDGIRSALG